MVFLHLEAFEANHKQLMDDEAAAKGIPFDLDPSTSNVVVPVCMLWVQYVGNVVVGGGVFCLVEDMYTCVERQP